LKKVLITGGAGFIGSHLADELIGQGYHVRVIDNLLPQVHGLEQKRPDYLNPEVELIIGDVRNADMLRRALQGIDVVYHLAAAVGVGQSMYEIESYTSTNNLGTAVLLEALIEKPVERLVVASSMSIYGEGSYASVSSIPPLIPCRTLEQLKAGQWDICDIQGEKLIPLPTAENKVPALASIYALSKYDQERMCLLVGEAYGISTVALRFFNIYGTRQSLSNPYTGVLAIFASRYLNNNSPLIFEDGKQLRDFVSIHDIVQACRLAMEANGVGGKVFNIGSGQCFTVLEVAQLMGQALNKSNHPLVTEKYRAGDIRHCFADISLAREVLGYQPQVSLSDGLIEFAIWLEGQEAFDNVSMASAELAARGLSV
jgi:dTDP-L-rhamnose 4-epimerase